MCYYPTHPDTPAVVLVVTRSSIGLDCVISASLSVSRGFIGTSYPGEAWDTVHQYLAAVACIVDMPSAVVVPATCTGACRYHHHEACWPVVLVSGYGSHLRASLPARDRRRSHCRMLARARSGKPGEGKSAKARAIGRMEVVAYLDQVLALCFGDQRLKLRGCESVHEASLGHDQQQDLGPCKNGQLVRLRGAQCQSSMDRCRTD